MLKTNYFFALLFMIITMTVINSLGQDHAGCPTREVVGNFEPKILDEINARSAGYLKAYVSEDIRAISKQINPKRQDTVRQYLEKHYRDEDYANLRSGIKRICIEKIMTTTFGQLILINALLEYEDNGRKPEPVFFYATFKNGALVFTELMFGNYETYHIDWPSELD